MAVLGWAPPAAAQQSPARPSSDAAPPVEVEELPVSVERIQNRLAQPSAISLDLIQPVFRLEVVERRPEWQIEIDWLGTRDGAPVPFGYPWHDQFLAMVTPPEARAFGAFTGTDLLQILATSLAQGLVTTAVTGKIKSALRERRQREAREEVDAAIEAWRRERETAGERPQAQPPPSPPE
jgi:hypothetical protein